MPATSYTLSEANAIGGHKLTEVIWEVNLVGGDFTGTITATPGGGTGQCQIYAPSIITFTGNGTFAKSFSFTPLTSDTVTFTFTNSGDLSDPSPATFTSTGLYLEDDFAGSADATLDGSSSDSIPGIPSGSAWTQAGDGIARFVGAGGMVYADTTSSDYVICTSAAAMPSSATEYSIGGLAGQIEVQFDIVRTGTVPDGARAGIILMADTTDFTYVHFEESGTPTFYIKRDGPSPVTYGYSITGPANGVTWRIRVNIITGDLSGVPTAGYTTAYVWYSTNGGSTWTSMFSCDWLTSDNPDAFKTMLYFYHGGSIANGLHIGNLLVQDIPPPSPNCHISAAYVASSGRSLAFEFQRDSDNSVVAPTLLNFLPVFMRNSSLIDVGFINQVPSYLINGSSTRAVFLLADGVQVNSGDEVTMSVADSWMTCGTGNASAGLVSYPLTNYVGVSAFGTDSLTKTLKPGFNISLEGVREATMPIVMANLRYRLARSAATTSVDGYPTSFGIGIGQSLFMLFDEFANGGNGIDSTSNPGAPGYYAIGYDDTAYGTPSQCALSIRGVDADGYGVWSNSRVTVTQITSCDNPGTNGVGQFYLFQVAPTAGSPDANLPIGLNWYFSGFSTGTCTPGVTNLFILGPGDFTVPSPGNTTWSFDRSNPYKLSNHFLHTMSHGCGMLRFMDSFLSWAGASNQSEPWEMRQLTDFSWNNTLYLNSVIGLTQIRGLYSSNSPYIYGDPSIFSVSGESWQSSSTLAADMGADQTTLTLTGNASTDPIIYGLSLTIGSEVMKVKGGAGGVRSAIDGPIVTVERGSSGTTATTHASGSTIAISSRWSWPSGGGNPLANFGGAGTQVVEILTNGPHNLKCGHQFGLYGSYPVMTFSDSTTNTLDSRPVWPTGSSSFVTLVFSNSAAPVTIAEETTYTLDVDNHQLWCTLPDFGFPVEMMGKITSAFSGCNLYVCMPLLCSDDYAYSFFRKLLANTSPGRKIYIELADEVWNPTSVHFTEILLGRWNGWQEYQWSTNRTLELRTIGRSVFSSAGREDEIQAVLNVQFVEDAGGTQLGYAESIGVPVDALAVAPYWGATNNASNVSAWESCTSISQMADLLVHEILFNPSNGSIHPAASINTVIDAYNTATSGNCKLIAYEGGYATGAPEDCGKGTIGLGVAELPYTSGSYGPVVPMWNHDIQYDPVWRIYQKDIWAAMQRYRFVDVSEYAHSFYGAYQYVWGAYRWVYQLPGTGDGSDGRFDNRACLATPGQQYSKASGVNQDQHCVSVRGKAQIEWMQQVNLSEEKHQPAIIIGGF